VNLDRAQDPVASDARRELADDLGDGRRGAPQIEPGGLAERGVELEPEPPRSRLVAQHPTTRVPPEGGALRAMSATSRPIASARSSRVHWTAVRPSRTALRRAPASKSARS
jgi:hypothetical protein